jgi:vacuolar-type H+-ATPase subunit E/Vma4
LPSKEIEATVGKVLDEESASFKALLGDALSSSLKLVDDYEKRASERYNESMLEGKKQAENIKRKVLGSAELQARNAQLSAFESFFEGIVIDSLAVIKGAPRDARYVKALSRLLKESLRELDEGEYTLSCDEKDKTALDDALKDVSKDFPRFRLSLSRKYIDSAGGFIIRSKDGTVEFNSTFEARLERMKPGIRKRVYERFFKGERRNW